jgi:hypothetical protein
VSSEIVFTITGGVGAGGVLSAYAEPRGREGERVFFFSKEDGSVELVVAAAGGQAAEGNARFPQSLSAGRYRVHAVIADRALDRGELTRASTEQTRRDGTWARVSVEVVATR